MAKAHKRVPYVLKLCSELYRSHQINFSTLYNYFAFQLIGDVGKLNSQSQV